MVEQDVLGLESAVDDGEVAQQVGGRRVQRQQASGNHLGQVERRGQPQPRTPPTQRLESVTQAALLSVVEHEHRLAVDLGDELGGEQVGVRPQPLPGQRLPQEAGREALLLFTLRLSRGSRRQRVCLEDLDGLPLSIGLVNAECDFTEATLLDRMHLKVETTIVGQPLAHIEVRRHRARPFYPIPTHFRPLRRTPPESRWPRRPHSAVSLYEVFGSLLSLSRVAESDTILVSLDRFHYTCGMCPRVGVLRVVGRQL